MQIFPFFPSHSFPTDSFVFRKDESINKLLCSVGYALHNVPNQCSDFPVTSVQREDKD